MLPSAAGRGCRAGELLGLLGLPILLGLAFLPFISDAGIIDGEIVIYSHFARIPTAFDLSVFPIMRSAAFRPTLELGLRLEYALAGFAPRWFALHNLFALLLLLILFYRFAERLPGQSGSALPLLTLAGLNYFNYELMGWHIVIADTLAVCSLLAVLTLFRRNTRPSYLLSLVVLLLGIGAKETAFLTPLLVVGTWWLMYPRMRITRPTLKMTGYVLIVGLYLICYFGFGGGAIRHQEWGFYDEFKAGLDQGPGYLGRYAGNLARGVVSLVNSYCLVPVRDRLSPLAIVPGLIILAGCVGPHRRVVWFGLLAAAFSLLPFGSFDLASATTDRYLFPGNLWLALSLTAGIRFLASRFRPHRWVFPLAVLFWGAGAVALIVSAPGTVAYSRSYRLAGEQIARINQLLPEQTVYLDRRLTPRFSDFKGHMVFPDQFCSIFLARSRFVSRPEMAVGSLVTVAPGPDDWVLVGAAVADPGSPIRFRLANVEYGLVRARALPPEGAQ